jgi:phosphohistidine swiveling domain-containing protein
VRTLVIATALAVAVAGLADLAAVAGPAQAGVPWLVTLKADATQVTLGQTVTFDQAPLMVSFDTASLVDGLDGFGVVGTPEVYRTQ